jgi:hypothetical protein
MSPSRDRLEFNAGKISFPHDNSIVIETRFSLLPIYQKRAGSLKALSLSERGVSTFNTVERQDLPKDREKSSGDRSRTKPAKIAW